MVHKKLHQDRGHLLDILARVRGKTGTPTNNKSRLVNDLKR